MMKRYAAGPALDGLVVAAGIGGHPKREGCEFCCGRVSTLVNFAMRLLARLKTPTLPRATWFPKAAYNAAGWF